MRVRALLWQCGRGYAYACVLHALWFVLVVSGGKYPQRGGYMVVSRHVKWICTRTLDCPRDTLHRLDERVKGAPFLYRKVCWGRGRAVHGTIIADHLREVVHCTALHHNSTIMNANADV